MAFSIPQQIIDNHGRPVTYMRLAVTDRCNLRCFYCMPEEGIDYMPKKDLLTYEEMLRLTGILARMGITKVRITGGEPFVRKDLMPFMERLVRIPGISTLNLTSNGVLTAPHIKDLKTMGLSSFNLSIDTLDRERFKTITRRDELPKVLETLDLLLTHGIKTKLNAVVMAGKNIEDLIPLAQMAQKYPIEVRFIEEMPFNGSGTGYSGQLWDHKAILNHLRHQWPEITPLPNSAQATARQYQIPGWSGTIGIIAAYTRTFCGTCNRIRITAQGTLKTCLYDDGVLDLRALLRGGADDLEIAEAFVKACSNRAKDGFEAEQNRKPVTESMSTIGG